MADSDLPVWSFRPNWREGVTERLAFLTDVMRAGEGAEQRRSIRQTPRRALEADFLLTGAERTFMDLFLGRLGGLEMMVPLYWDIHTLTSATVAGVTDSIAFDNTRREFVPGLAILSGKTALSYEVVEIDYADDAGVTLTNPTLTAWPRGTRLMPLRRGVIEDVGELAHLAGGVATMSAQMRLVVANHWTPEADASPVLGGLPVFLNEPNWAETLTTNYDKDIVTLDPGYGLPYQVDQLGRAVAAQSHRWFLPGREALAGFRDLLYRHRGRAGMFWLPTFKHDLRLVNSPGSGATQIEVQNVGFGYTGGPSSGREYLAIKHAGGTILRKITSVIAGTSAATERVNLDAPLGLALSPGLVRRISFLDTARFDQDEFDIIHHGGLDGLAEANAIFRTVKNTRTAPEPVSYPIPAGVMSDTPCGDDPGECYVSEPPEPVDWLLKIRYVMYRAGGIKMTNYTNVTPESPLSYGQNINFITEEGTWNNGSTVTSPTGRPVSRTERYDYGDGLVPWDGTANPTVQGVVEYTYYDHPDDSFDPDAVKNTVDRHPSVGDEMEIFFQTQHGSGSIESGTRGYHEYMWFDDEDWRRVTYGDYITFDDYPGDPLTDTFPVPGLWPVARRFYLWRY